MALYTATDSNEIQVKEGRSTKTIARVPNDFMAALIRKHLNDPRGVYRIVHVGRVSEIQASDGEVLLSTRTTTFDPKVKPLTQAELEELLAHLNRLNSR